MNLIKKISFAVLASAMLGEAALATGLRDGLNAAQPKNDKGEATTPTGLAGGGAFKTIADVLIYLTAAISVIVIVLGGLRYVTSTGDASRIKQAKDTILYGVIGLVIAILAYAIVNFIVKNFK